MKKITIENGVAKLYEQTLLGSVPAQSLVEFVETQKIDDTGFLKQNVVRVKRTKSSTEIFMLSPSGLKVDGITHPDMLFIFKSSRNEKSIKNIRVYYVDSPNIREGMTIRDTAHRNVFESAELCIGTAFPMPPGIDIFTQAESIVGRYFAAAQNGDLDHVVRMHFPKNLGEGIGNWDDIRIQKIDLRDKVKEFRNAGKLY